MKSKYLALTIPIIVLLGALMATAPATKGNSSKARKKIVFLCGDDLNHASGTHEFYAGSLLLKSALENSNIKDFVDVKVVNNWPKDASVFNGADAIIHYYKGNKTHFMNKHHEFIEKLAAQGSSQMFMHYGVDPDPVSEPSLKKWTGGFYKDRFSTNPHWPLQSNLQNHPINSGVNKYLSYDEWYLNMQFENEIEVGYQAADKIDQVYSVMHGENVDFKKANRIKPNFKRELSAAELTVFWAKERSDGGRGVGMTGGHYHKNWANDAFRKQVLNAIAWCAKIPVPEKGVSSPKVTETMINANLDDRKKGGLKKIVLTSEANEPKKKAKKKAPKKNSGVKAENPYNQKKSISSNLSSIHPFFKLENIDDLGTDDLKIGGMCFDGDDLYVATLSPDRLDKAPDHQGKILRVENVTTADGKQAKIKTSVVVSDLYEPAAVAVVNGHVYVGTKTQILRFDNATTADKTFKPADAVVLVDGLSTVNFHTYTIGFEQAIIDGKTYLFGNFTTAIVKGGKRDVMTPPNPKVNRGSTFRLGPVDGSETADTVVLQYLAGGFRTPNGIEVGPDNEVYVADNQGIFNPSNELIRIKPGSFYGHYLLTEDGRAAAFQPKKIDDQKGGAKGQTGATVHLPQGTVARSPAQPHVIRADEGVLAPYDGQILLCEFTTGAILRVAMEQVKGVWQGVAFQHSGGKADKNGNNGFTGGPNRIEQGPDGNYYIGQIGAGGLWQFNNTAHGLQRFRVKQSGDVPKDFNEILNVKVIEGGFEVEFLKPLKSKKLAKEDLEVLQWTYIPTQNYGGKPVDTQRLQAKQVSLDKSGKKAVILIDGLRDGSDQYVIKQNGYTSDNTGFVVNVKLKSAAPAYTELYTKEFWYTLHQKLGGEDLDSTKIVRLNEDDIIKQTFQSNCLSCHNEALTAAKAVPDLKGLLGRKQKVLRNGKEVEVTVDRNYIINSIVNPDSEKVPAYQSVVMPNLGINKRDAAKLADFIIEMGK